MTVLPRMANMQAVYCVEMVVPGTAEIGAIDPSGNGRMVINEAVLGA